MNDEALESIKRNREKVLRDIEETCRDCGRNAQEITLIAVSKKFSEDRIKMAFELGQNHFGENFAQELKRKAEVLNGPKWHFIGKLQSNKINQILPHTFLLHTLDRLKLAETLQKKCSTSNRSLNVLIQVNISEEDQKNGIAPGELLSFAKGVKDLPNLKVQGLMAMAEQQEDPEKTRPCFKKMKELFLELNSEVFQDSPLKELSMGMSGDFKVAIEEGSTMIRVGTALFGPRPIGPRPELS